MLTVDEATADAIRRAFNEGGELAAVVELRRHFPLIQDNEQARACVGRSPAGSRLRRWASVLHGADRRRVEPSG
jgi:hypothetical protein